MAKIKKLPPEIISKIAAGEVIERPYFAIKELIDNAIDAEATVIKIKIWDSGIKKIIVTDNGEGMAKEDVFLSALPHTTSKIRHEDDLLNISTLGFRGEALSSIGAISDLTIQSKKRNTDAGAYINVSYGKEKKKGDLGMIAGTKITIENLFSNVPARKKFLKSKRTEFRHIVDTVIYFAITYPSIAFYLSHNDKTIIDIKSSNNLIDRLTYLYGTYPINTLIPFSFKEGYIEISGYIGHPQSAVFSSQKLIITINKRKVQNLLILNSIKEAFTNLIDAKAYPIGVVFIDVPYEIVDVNIHPRKEEVAFANSSEIFQMVTNCIKEVLTSHNLTFSNVSWRQKLTKSQLGKELKSDISKLDVANIGNITNSRDVIQVHNTYLIAESERGILLIDQHAAHESLLYHEFLKAYHKKRSETIQLSHPLMVNLSPSNSEVILENKDILLKIGFNIEEFGNNTIRINTLPRVFKDRDINEIITDIIDSIKEEKHNLELDEHTKQMLATLSCKSAIKAGDTLSNNQIHDLINKLTPENMIYTCPHGRPVKIDIPLTTLAHWMKRH